MIIRSLRQSDLTTIAAIENTAQLGAWTLEIFQQCYDRGCPGWVLVRDDVVIGFLMMSVQANECHLLNVCVHRDFQRQGFGEKLLNFLLTELTRQDVRAVFLEVRRSNAPAIALYQKLDFVQIGERINYYVSANKNEDALVFAKELIR